MLFYRLFTQPIHLILCFLREYRIRIALACSLRSLGRGVETLSRPSQRAGGRSAGRGFCELGQQNLAARCLVPHRLLQFGRTAALALIVLLTLGFAWRSGQTRDQREAVKSIRYKNVIVHYDYQRAKASAAGMAAYDPKAEPATPGWVRRLLGDAFLYDVAYVEVAPPYPPEDAVDEFLARLPDCPVIYR